MLFAEITGERRDCAKLFLCLANFTFLADFIGHVTSSCYANVSRKIEDEKGKTLLCEFTPNEIFVRVEITRSIAPTLINGESASFSSCSL